MAVQQPARITVTGGAGNIGYSLLFRIAAGELLGSDVPVILRLLEVEPAMRELEGVAMELTDCAFPLLEGIDITSDVSSAFVGANWAILAGAAQRDAGMSDESFVATNAAIYRPQGRALNDSAADDVRVMVVGNPCNTNCMVARTNAPDIPADRWFAMMRLDENRARYQLAQRAAVEMAEVTNLAVWGNHSPTQYPDFANARIGGQPVPEIIEDEHWLRHDFLTLLQQRGGAVLAARGEPAAASAANAVIDSVNAIHDPEHITDITSLAVVSRGEYGIPEGLQFGFPVRVHADKSWEVADHFHHDEFARAQIERTTDELLAERKAAAEFLW